MTGCYEAKKVIETRRGGNRIIYRHKRL